MYSIYTDYKTKDLHGFLENGEVANATYLGELNKRPDIYEKMNFNGKTFVASVINDEKKAAFVEETKVLEEGTEFEYEIDAICPYCGSKQMDSWELSGDDGEENETYCGSCGEEFKYVRNIEVTYSTYQK